MKQYHHKEETPLAFHKFLWYFSFPVGFLISISRMISELSKIYVFNWLYAIDIGFYMTALTLILICFIGFFNWKTYAWYGIMVYLCVIVAYHLYAVILYAIYIPNQIGTQIGQLLGILIYAIPVGIYYYKRRPLFFPMLASTNTANNPESTDTCKINNDSFKELPQVKYCRKCGYQLLPDGDYCSKCGTPVVKE